MKKLLQKRLNQKGLTLIELLAVIVILAIIAAIAIPAIGGLIANSRYNAVKADAINVINAANLYYTENPDAADNVTVTTLIADDFIESAGSIPGAATVSKASPRELNGTVPAADYNGTDTVQFSGATVDEINADDQKGSDAGNKVVPTAPATGG